MSTIEELLATPQVEEVWEVDNRYVINSSYSDDQGPIEIVGKDIGDMSSQISIQGESISQYVEFIMPRYYDNIDLSEKNIVIHYTAGDRGGENAPINVYKSQERIKFGWAIPASATANEGTLSIGIWARGYVGTEEYMWKSRIAYYKVERGPVLGEGLSEPDVQWYLDFVREMDAKVVEASLYSTRAKQSENVAVESKESAIASSQTASDSANTAVKKAAEASSSASVASAHSTAAKVSADNAKESETKAQGYAEEARNNAEGFEPISDMMTGESPTATNSTNAPLVSLKVKGKTEQFTTSGKNLCNSNDFTITAPDSGTEQSNYAYKSIDIHDKIVSNKTYIFSADVKKLVGSPSEISIVFMNEALSTGTEIKTGTITNNHVEISISIGNASVYYYLLVYAGKQGSTAGNSIEFSNVMLRESTTDSTYEPYTGGIASPNPDYLQEINGLAKDGAIEVKTTGKNMINDSTVIGKTGVIDTYHDVKFKPNKTYYFVAKTTSGDGMATGYFGVYLLDENGKSVVSYINQANKYVSEFTLTEEQANSIVKCRITANGIQPSDMLVTEVAIAETPEYEPYAETTAAIPTDAPLYEGDYLEVYADGSGKLYKKFMNFNPTTIEAVAENVGAYIKLIKGYCKARSTALCNYLKLDTTGQTTGFNFGGNAEGNFSHCFIKVLGLTTKEEYQSWLNERSDLEVVYELAKPTETELTAEQVEQFKKLYTFEPVTNVFCDGEVEMIYFRNNPNGRVAGMLQKQIDSAVSILSSTEEVSDEYRNNLS